MTANPASPLTPVAHVPTDSGASSRLTPLDPVRVIRRYLRLFLAMVIIGILVGIGLALVLEKVAPKYTSEAFIEVTGGPVSPYEAATAQGPLGRHRLEVIAAFIRNQTVLLKSDTVINESLNREEVKQTAWFSRFPDNTARREDLQQRLEANRVLGSTMIRVAMTDGDADGLQTVIDTTIAEYLALHRSQVETANVGVRRTFEDESKRSNTEVQQAQRQLDTFLELNDLPTLSTHSNEATIAYGDLARQVGHTAIQLQTARNVYDAMTRHQQEAGDKATPEELASAASQPAVYHRDERLRGLRENRDVYIQRFGPGHRMVQSIDRQIVAVEAERDQELVRVIGERRLIGAQQARRTVEALEAQLATLAPQLRDARNRVREITLKLERYSRLKEAAEAAQKKGEAADDWLHQSQLMRGRTDSAGVDILTKASAPVMTFPNFQGIVVGMAVLFLLLSVALVFVKELLDQRIKSPSDIGLIPNTNVMGLLPEADEDPLGPVQIENVVHRDPTGLLSEAFRQTRTGLLTQMKRGGLKTIMVVGAQPECGVSSVLNNLAVSLSLDGRKVLVIDANFRRPMQHMLFTTRSAPGLMDVLQGGVSFDSAVVHLSEPNLDVLAAGNSQSISSESLEGAAFQSLMEMVSSKYDVVLIDAPPALLTSESLMMARQVNGVVAVVRASRDKRGMVARMLRELEAADANVLGVVLNGVQASAGGYFRKNYDEFHKYRQGGGDMAYAGDAGPGDMEPNPADVRIVSSAPEQRDGADDQNK